MKVARALVSVSDKGGLEPFVRGLVELGVEIISTGGTARHRAGGGIAGHRHLRRSRVSPRSWTDGSRPYTQLSTGAYWPTGDARAHGGHCHLGIKPIDLVVVNLYPFEATVAQRGVTEAEASRISISAVPAW